MLKFRLKQLLLTTILLSFMHVSLVQAQPDNSGNLIPPPIDYFYKVGSFLLSTLQKGATQEWEIVMQERFREFEQRLAELNQRLQSIEQRVQRLEDEFVRTQNLQRLHDLMRLTLDLQELTAELQRRPTNADTRFRLVTRAERLARELKDNPGLHLWRWHYTEPLAERFYPLEAFELYSEALLAWLDAILLYEGPQNPARIVAVYGPRLMEHVNFLRMRQGWNDLFDPVTLVEHVKKNVLCLLDAEQTYADQNGVCTFNEVCNDLILAQQELGQTLAVQMPAGNNVLCTWDPDQPRLYSIEDDMENRHGLEVMERLAAALEKMAQTGSLREQYVGVFEPTFHGPIFSLSQGVPYAPVFAPSSAEIGAAVYVFTCTLAVLGCTFEQFPREGRWISNRQDGTIRHLESGLCLTAQSSILSTNLSGTSLTLRACHGGPSQSWQERGNRASYELVNNLSGMCATARTHFLSGTPIGTSLVQEPCDRSLAQKFSGSDGTGGDVR